MPHSHRKSRTRQRAVGIAVGIAVALGIALPVALLLFAGDDATGNGQRAGQSPAATTSASPTPGPGTTSTPDPEQPITLSAASSSVARLERLAITGTVAGASPGTLLRVQLLLPPARWVDLPVPTVVDDSGGFTTYVALDRPGTNQLRVRDPASGLTSNVLSVTVS